MDVFTSLLFSAILLGCTYTLVAIGYCLFFGVLDVVVFCSGDIAVFGAFSIIGAYVISYDVGLFQVVSLPIATLLILTIAAVLCAGLALIAYLVSVKPFERSSALMPLLSTIALGTVIREVLGLMFKPIIDGMAKAVTQVGDPIMVTSGRNPQAVPKLIVPDGTILQRNLIIVAVTIVILLILFFFLNKTTMGLSMQAISQNRELAFASGINVKRDHHSYVCY